jgi:hypothetical protein
MNNMSQLSLKRIIETDYISYISVLAPLVLGGVAIFGLLTGREVTTTYLYVMVGISSAGLLAIIWRYMLFTSIFEDGQQVPAKITHVSFYRDRGTVGYEYTYMGQTFKSSSMLHKVSRVTKLQVDEQVIVLVDRNKPKRAFIKDLYLQA